MSGRTLHGVDPQAFLQQDWQTRPRLLRNALDPALFPLQPEELAGLACEQEVESRLIRGCADSGFSLRHGPFDDEDFTSLPARDWTLLVQAVDHLLPEVADLLDYFRFIPNWRIDDVMVSFAVPGGSAGPHYDHYDVFLIQGRGSRRWLLGDPVAPEQPLQPHPDLHLIAPFEVKQEWLLHAGDILYLPPRFAHWGISESSDCMTYSVGFRAPSRAELLSDFCDRAMLELSDFDRFRDDNPSASSRPGEITPEVIQRVQQMVLEPLADSARLTRWFGQYMTEPRRGAVTEPLDSSTDIDTFRQRLAEYQELLRDPASRFAYSRVDGGYLLFVDGHAWHLDDGCDTFVDQLCKQRAWSADELAEILAEPAQCDVLLALYQLGSLYFEDELYDP